MKPEPSSPPPNTRTIARAATLVMVFFALSRVLGLARDVVIAGQFGTNPDYEAYLAAFRLPDFLFNVVSGGALGSAFIPTFTGYLARDDREGAWRLASAIINWVLVVLVGLGSLAALFALPLMRTVIAPGFTDPAQTALAASLMRWLMVSTVLFGVSGLLMGILNAHQHFLLPALAPVVYNLAIIGGAWFLGP
ncbi:MAG: murein biosynthesis integral membrane protein MurJ, partial [Caldilineae bacterium]